MKQPIFGEGGYKACISEIPWSMGLSNILNTGCMHFLHTEILGILFLVSTLVICFGKNFRYFTLLTTKAGLPLALVVTAQCIFCCTCFSWAIQHRITLFSSLCDQINLIHTQKNFSRGSDWDSLLSLLWLVFQWIKCQNEIKKKIPMKLDSKFAKAVLF